MKKSLSIFAILWISLLAAACSNKDGAASGGPHATVFLRDGTQYSGAVKNASSSSITVAGDDNTTRTFNMRDVRSVDYGDTPAAAPESQRASSSVDRGNAPSSSVRENPVPRGERGNPPPPAPRRHPESANIQTKTYQLPAGTEITVRTDETIDSKKAVPGQTFAAEVAKDVVDSAGDIVIPRGSNAQIVIRSASKGGRVSGQSDLVLDLQSVSVDGQLYQLDTTDIEQHGRQGLGANKRTGEFVGGGALVGTIIGAIAGHGKGAAIGAGSGAAAGAVTQVLTRGGSIRVPAETLLTFKLDKPLRVHPARQK